MFWKKSIILILFISFLPFLLNSCANRGDARKNPPDPKERVKRNSEIAISNGLTIRNDKPENIGDLWGVSALDEEFRIVNQHLKYLKFGFGHVTDQVCEAIHQGLMDRSEAVKLVKKYDGNCSEDYIKYFCDFLEITSKEFWDQADKFVNKNLFEKVNGKWKPKFTVK